MSREIQSWGGITPPSPRLRLVLTHKPQGLSAYAKHAAHWWFIAAIMWLTLYIILPFSPSAADPVAESARVLAAIAKRKLYTKKTWLSQTKDIQNCHYLDPAMGLCKPLFTRWRHSVSAPSFEHIYLLLLLFYIYYYINIYFMVIFLNIFLILQMSSISLASFQCNQNNFGKWSPSLPLSDNRGDWDISQW